MFLKQSPCQGPVWVGIVCKDAISSFQQLFLSHCVKSTVLPGPEEAGGEEIQANGGEPFATIQTGDFFFPFLKIQRTKVTKIKVTVPSAAIILLLAEQERGINMSSYAAVHATYVQGAKLWVLREPWFWMSWLVKSNILGSFFPLLFTLCSYKLYYSHWSPSYWHSSLGYAIGWRLSSPWGSDHSYYA